MLIMELCGSCYCYIFGGHHRCRYCYTFVYMPSLKGPLTLCFMGTLPPFVGMMLTIFMLVVGTQFFISEILVNYLAILEAKPTVLESWSQCYMKQSVYGLEGSSIICWLPRFLSTIEETKIVGTALYCLADESMQTYELWNNLFVLFVFSNRFNMAETGHWLFTSI